MRRHFAVKPRATRNHSGPLIILTVGRISPRKGQLQFIEALGRMPESMKTRVVYKIAGPAVSKSYLRKIQKTAKKMSVTLEYEGKTSQDELIRLYSSSDIFALTSIYYKKSVEGFGLVFLEASAHGLPIIATRSGGIEDAVLDNKTGILLPVCQQETWTQQIMRLISDPALREKMGSEGTKWATHFSWDFVVKNLFET